MVGQGKTSNRSSLKLGALSGSFFSTMKVSLVLLSMVFLLVFAAGNVMAEPVLGCTDPSAINYNHNATPGNADAELCVYLGTIIIVKETIGGGDGEFEFMTDYSDPFTLSNGESYESTLLEPGIYSVSETTFRGWDLTSATCDDGSSPDEIDLDSGEVVTCTFTNTKRGHIIVEKQTLPGGDETLFTFTGGAAGEIGDEGIIGVEVAPGTYDSTETVPLGWDLTEITCDDENSFGDLETGTATFNVDAGETVTCTFTNTKKAKLTVTKHVVNDNGGDAVASEFTMIVTDNLGGLEFPGDEEGTTITVEPGEYSVTETELDGYSSSTEGDCSGFIEVGEEKTCTITNDDISPTITLHKLVTNDNGGDAVASDFTLFINEIYGDDEYDEYEVSQDEPAELYANTGYTLSESNLDGYESVSISGEGCPSSLDEEFTLNEGENLDCTIVNDDIAPQLTVIKQVINNNEVGNLEDEDFTIYVKINDEDVEGSPAEGSEYGVIYTLNAGSYIVSETQDIIYTATFSGDCDAQGNVVLEIGDEKTCIITNDDALTVITGYKWEDVNSDGVWQEEEPGLADWQIRLEKVTNEEPIETELVALSLTGKDGGFEFPINSEGHYRVSEESKRGWVRTSQDSFFDIFVELENLVSSPNLQFGNHKLVVISDESTQDVLQNSVAIAWTTDEPATSRVIYDTVSHLVLGDGSCPAPNEALNCYGYASSTSESDTGPKVLNHSVTLSDLTPGTTYFYRTISSASPESVSEEDSVTTTSAPSQNSGVGSAGGGGGGGGATTIAYSPGPCLSPSGCAGGTGEIIPLSEEQETEAEETITETPTPTPGFFATITGAVIGALGTGGTVALVFVIIISVGAAIVFVVNRKEKATEILDAAKILEEVKP